MMMDRKKTLTLAFLALLPAHGGAKIIQSTGSGGVATALSRDKSTGDLMVVGTTFAEFWDMESTISHRGCFIATANMDSTSLQRKAFHTPEMCFGDAVAIPQSGVLQSLAVVAGTSPSGESNLITFYDYEHPENEFIVDQFHLPVSMIHEEGDKIIMALHENDEKWVDEELAGNVDSYNLQSLLDYWERLTVPGKVTSSTLTLKKMSVSTGRVQFDSKISTLEGTSTISGMLKIRGEKRFVVAGSTNGSGIPFGQHPRAKHDWDGYIAIYDSTSGELIYGGNNHRISSLDEKDDFVHGICAHKNELYIVGTTTGVVADGAQAGGAFLVKMNMENRQVEWKRQLSSNIIMHDGVACTASHHHGVVIGGNVLKSESDSLEQITRQVFVSRFTSDGTRLWLKYLDSTLKTGKPSDDYLVDLDIATGGGLNALLNSRISEKGENDIVLLDIDIETGKNDLSKDEPVVVEEEPKSGNKVVVILGALVFLYGFVVFCRRKYKKEKITLDHLANDPDYIDNNGYKDDEEIWDFDHDGFVEHETGMRVSIRENQLAFIMG